MNELNERLSSGAESIWGKFCRAVSECDLKWAVVLPAAIGALTIVAGVVQEAHGQTDLIIQGGVLLSTHTRPVTKRILSPFHKLLLKRSPQVAVIWGLVGVLKALGWGWPA